MATTQPDETLNTMESDEPYALKMAWFNSSNFLTPTCSAQPKRWHKALQKLEFVVIQDLTQTPTSMAVGDYFLPMATWAEHDGIVLTHYGRNTVFMGPMNKALQVGECKSDIEICLMFGQRLNPTWWPWYKPAGDTLDVSKLAHSESPAEVTSAQGRGKLDLDALQAGVEQFFSDQLSELGYETTAIHPNLATNWNRESVFEQLGYLDKPSSRGLADGFFLEDLTAMPCGLMETAEPVREQTSLSASRRETNLDIATKEIYFGILKKARALLEKRVKNIRNEQSSHYAYLLHEIRQVTGQES